VKALRKVVLHLRGEKLLILVLAAVALAHLIQPNAKLEDAPF